MSAHRGQGDYDEAPSPQRRMFRSGTLLIIGLGIFLLVGWVFYRQTLPPGWLRDFSEEVSLRSSADPSPPEPEDIRQVSPQVDVDSPYVCAANVIDIPWDRMFAVTARQGLSTHPVLAGLNWPGQPLSHYVELLGRDERYQLLVLVDGDAVADAQLYFTFWGDLSPISRPEGYAREQAVFTSASLNGLYIVSPVENVPPGACP